jgi:hypothetical protein
MNRLGYLAQSEKAICRTCVAVGMRHGKSHGGLTTAPGHFSGCRLVPRLTPRALYTGGLRPLVRDSVPNVDSTLGFCPPNPALAANVSI